MKSSLLVLLSLATPASSFVNGVQDLFARAYKAKPELIKYTNGLTGSALDIRLDVGDNGKTPGMSIQNLVLLLKENHDSANHIPMPGFNGPHPNTSGGIGVVEVEKPGQFVTINGVVKPKFKSQASWELIWRQDAPAGALLCGLELKEDAVRNAASLPKGKLYISFPVWTADKLSEYQERKAISEETASKLLEERDSQLQKMHQTDNLLAKALHYRNAAAAVEEHSLQPLNSMAKVPWDSEVVPLGPELLMTRTGTLWTKGGNGFMGATKQVLLGTANAKSAYPESSSEEAVADQRLPDTLAKSL